MYVIDEIDKNKQKLFCCGVMAKSLTKKICLTFWAVVGLLWLVALVVGEDDNDDKPKLHSNGYEMVEGISKDVQAV